jgi:hypothetical protein
MVKYGMENGLNGMRMDRKNMKELTRMGNEMDWGLIGMRMDRNR